MDKFPETKTGLEKISEPWWRSNSSPPRGPTRWTRHLQLAWSYMPIEPSPPHPLSPHALLQYRKGHLARRASNVKVAETWSMRWRDTQKYYDEGPTVEWPLALDANSLKIVLDRMAESGYEHPVQYELGIKELFQYRYLTQNLFRMGMSLHRLWRFGHNPYRQYARDFLASLLLFGRAVLELVGSVLTIALALFAMQVCLASGLACVTLALWALKLLVLCFWRLISWFAGNLWLLLRRAII